MEEKVRILYMEDDQGIARLLQKRLERMGYEIDLAPNGEVGLELSVTNQYDGIIVDYNMPGLDGLQVIERLAQNAAMPPTIMLTGTGNEQVAVEALKRGAFDYVVKDIDAVYLDLLPTVIDQGLQSRQLLRDKQLAEEKLDRSEKYHRSLIENSPDLIVAVDSTGIIRYISPSFREIFGFDEQRIVGQNGLTILDSQKSEFFEGNEANRLLEYFDALAASSNVSMETELRVRDQTGVWRWLEIRGRNLLHEPWIESYVFNIREISQRKRAEEALRESEERFRMLFELAPDPYYINDLMGNLIDCNQAVEPLLGISKTELIGKNFVEMGILDLNEVMKVASLLSEIPSEVPERPPELTVTRADGQKRSIDLRAIPIQTKGETQILGIGHDITWRKQAEMQMKVHIDQLESLRQIDDELTRKLDIQYVQSMALTRMIDMSCANAGCIALMSEKGPGNIQSQGYPLELDVSYFLRERSIVSRAVQLQKPEWVQDVRTDCDYFPVIADTCSQMVFPLKSQNRLMGIVSLETNLPDCFTTEMFEVLKLVAARIAVAIDNAQLYESRQQQLIELQNLYEKIRGLEQLKTDMIRLAAHDLRSPLSSILVSTFLLRKASENGAPDKCKTLLDGIDGEVEQMQTMISNFLSVERIEEITQGTFTGQETDLRDLVQSVIAGFQIQCDGKAQTCRLSITDAPVIVRGVKAELQQVIVNLVGNAVKYTPNGGTIAVTLQSDYAVARFEVADTGFGIPADQQAELFQPFFRAQTAETKSIEGTGLGLYLVKRIIERNHGGVIFSSEYGKGSIFGFTLPLAQE